MSDNIRYPIGIFLPEENLSQIGRSNLIEQVLQIAPLVRGMTNNLDQSQLQTPYRVDGWTIQQIIHHMADNDMNAYLRFKRALTEDLPTTTSYREDLWGDLHDYFDTEIETSITLLESLHRRFYKLLFKLNSDHFTRTLRTQALGIISLETALQRFIWHNHHHMSQIEFLIKRQRW